MRRLLFLAALLVTAPWLASCAGSRADGPTVIRIWHLKDAFERAVMEEFAARYMAQNPDVRIELLYKETEELRNHYVFGAVGGKGPDLIYGPADNIGIFGLTDVAMPLDDVLPADFKAQFRSEGLVQWEGQTLLVADQVGTHLAFVYNKALMPTPPRSIAELIEMGKTLSKDTNGDGRLDQYTLVWNYTEPFFFVPFLTSYNGWVFDEREQPTLDTPETVRAIQTILDFRDKYKLIPRESDYNTAETLFKEGRAAAVINGAWAWAGYGEAGIDYGVTRIPFNDATGEWPKPMFAARGYAVNPAVPPDKLPAVLEVLMYLTGPDVQREMAQRLFTIPTLTALRADTTLIQSSPVLQASIDQISIARPMPLAPQLRQVWDGMRGPYQLVMNGAVTAEEGAAMMQENVTQLIRDAGLATVES